MAHLPKDLSSCLSLHVWLIQMCEGPHACIRMTSASAGGRRSRGQCLRPPRLQKRRLPARPLRPAMERSGVHVCPRRASGEPAASPQPRSGARHASAVPLPPLCMRILLLLLLLLPLCAVSARRDMPGLAESRLRPSPARVLRGTAPRRLGI